MPEAEWPEPGIPGHSGCRRSRSNPGAAPTAGSTGLPARLPGRQAAGRRWGRRECRQSSAGSGRAGLLRQRPAAGADRALGRGGRSVWSRAAAPRAIAERSQGLAAAGIVGLGCGQGGAGGEFNPTARTGFQAVHAQGALGRVAGNGLIDEIIWAANEYPNVKYLVLDTPLDKEGIDLPNYLGQMCSQSEVSYLAGYLGMRMSETGKIGVIVGVNIQF